MVIYETTRYNVLTSKIVISKIKQVGTYSYTFSKIVVMLIFVYLQPTC